MSLSQLDPHAALIVIDLQNGIVGLPVAHSATDIVSKAATLTDAFRQQNLPVVLVNVVGGAPGRTDANHVFNPPEDFIKLVPELNQQASDHLITKRTWGAFSNTDLDQYLKGHQITQVFICGIATSIGVESTARFASELGYHVVLISDAMTDMNIQAHENSIQNIFPRLGEVSDTAEVIKTLA